MPGAGRIVFDPTNRNGGEFNLIPVTMARDIHQTIPVGGSFADDSDAFDGMRVEVEVVPSDPSPAARRATEFGRCSIGCSETVIT